MSWPLRLIEYVGPTNATTLNIGDCFFYTPHAEFDPDEDWGIGDDAGWGWPSVFARAERLSDAYRKNNGHRPPLLIWMPGRTLFCPDAMCWRTPPGGKTEYYGGWEVRGDVSNLTVSPSINIVGSYHGYIQNGIILDDCDGRLFP